MAILPILLSILLLLGQSLANVEKTIFLGPAIRHAKNPAFSSLQHLTPDHSTHRTQLHSRFDHSPTIDSIPSIGWYVLDGLKAGARYEVRVCWAADQPTAFELETFTGEQERGKKLLALAGSELESYQGSGLVQKGDEGSWVLLRVEAQADYFTMNRTLMHDGLVVDIDLILDPYLLNVVPRSLIPTSLHILAVAAVAAVAVRLLLKHLDGIVAAGIDSSRDKKKV